MFKPSRSVAVSLDFTSALGNNADRKDGPRACPELAVERIQVRLLFRRADAFFPVSLQVAVALGEADDEIVPTHGALAFEVEVAVVGDDCPLG